MIDGPQTEWNGNVHVGGSDAFDGGLGNLMVSGGANQNLGNLDVALDDGASGNVDLVDAGTLWTASDVVIGNRGVATFNVLGDAALRNRHTGRRGRQPEFGVHHDRRQ